MAAGQKNFHTCFARVSPGFFPTAFSIRAALGLFLSVTIAFIPSFAFPCGALAADEASANSNVRREAASAQFAKAEELRTSLDQKAPTERTLADYKQVATAYRRVALITPKAPEVPDSLLDLGEVYTEMGDRFGRSYYQLAVDSYLFLVREYPGYKHCQEALLRAGKLQRENLNDSEHAEATYKEFLKRFPRSPHKREAQEALAELALLRNNEAPTEPATNGQSAPKYAADEAEASAKRSPEKAGRQREDATTTATANRDSETPVAGGEPAASGYAPRVRRIRASATAESTRVIIDLEDSVQYTSGRVANPDRIFFDLHAARLTPELLRGKIAVEGELLSAVRVAQNQAGVVRVVLDVNSVKGYAASLTHNPTQLVIDLYAASSAPVRTARAQRDSGKAASSRSNEKSAEASDVETVAAKNSDSDSVAPAAARANSAILNSASANSAAAKGASSANVRTDAKSPVVPVVGAPVSNASAPSPAGTKSVKASAAKGGAKGEVMKPASAAQPTRDGNSTLTRVLGLKIGRIVIDAGHGGYDTGTIGPTGLMEKDLCLDVALRLGKIIQQRLPGAEVVFTRSDDTFVPLEERTAIANQAKADLFVSIHANSSPDHGARGVETYYLNLKGSPEAMEVAARENAVSQTGIHDLEDLVKRITQTEKIDESKEFAEDVQVSLSQRIQKSVRTVKNRGVRKAPFVVLVGADMPSILTEISFLSNPADELLLKKPEHRQRVAEGIYQGMAAYLQSLNSVTMNAPQRGSHAAERPVEQSRNQK
jgi:N-acetylmuramoyl-L-alanine amidase